ncbi:MAG: divergent PAP2 family protein [Oscillospiraceae bacterium]|jgi:acid phosphatase family membrane protein YuiD|nr:divergent PAP2 family protein [Oscillospiraceae bacterium]
MRITGNPVIDCAVAAWLLAQVAKALLELLLERRLRPARLVSSGGMPSSHSACVMGCTTAVGRFSGLTSPLFGVCVVFSLVVMYDACNVRRSAGDTARLVNQLLSRVELLTAEELAEDLKIIMGHTPFQVLMGALLGVAVGMLW